MEDIKKKITEFVELAKLCPENLQEVCFELLLQDFLDSKGGKGISKPKLAQAEESGEEPPAPAAIINQGSEIQTKDLHTKTKRIVPSELSLEEINNLFYKEDGNILPLYDDLKSPKVAEAQIRVALLEALKNGLTTGDFSFNVKVVRGLCDLHKCLDTGNFSTNFKTKEDYFNEAYDLNGNMSLNSKGKDAMVKVAKEIAK